MKYTKEEIQYAKKKLVGIVKPGDKLLTVLRNCSRSGMSRSISVIHPDGANDITFWVSRAIENSIDQKNGGIKISGCGMNMGFEIVYLLGRVLFPDGFGEEGTYKNGSKGRPTTKEMAKKCVEKGVVFRGRNGDASGWDNDGGYALKQAWM